MAEPAPPSSATGPILVCGLGHVGTCVVRLLRRLGLPVVVITRIAREDWLRSARSLGVKVLIGDDTEGKKAKVLSHDSELDLAWVQLDEAPATPLKAVDLDKAAAASVGQHIYLLSRMDKYFDRANVINEGRVRGVVQKPRHLLAPGGNLITDGDVHPRRGQLHDAVADAPGPVREGREDDLGHGPLGHRGRQVVLDLPRGTSLEGCIRRWASSPSLVNSSRPEVLTSRRPTTIQRPCGGGGRRSNTVGRPCGSERVVTSPTGL